jgi:hypothetical protein
LRGHCRSLRGTEPVTSNGVSEPRSRFDEADGPPYIGGQLTTLNIDDYRTGYEDGVEASKTPGQNVVRAVFSMIETPSYRKGWDDGYHGRPYIPGERGLFDTEDDAEDEEENEGAEEESNHIYRSRSSNAYESSGPSIPVPLTRSEKRKRLLGQIVFVSAFFVSVLYDWFGNAFTFLSVFYALMYVAILSYVAYRVIYRLKYWGLLIIVFNIALLSIALPTTPWRQVVHDILVADISNLAGIALIYGIYKFFTG